MTTTNSFRKTISIILMLCMAAFVFCGTATDSHAAAKYKKTITKTVTVKPGKKCVIKLDVKDSAKVTVTATTKAKKENIHTILNLAGKQKEGFLKKTTGVSKNVTSRKCTIFVGNAKSKPVKYTIKISADKKVLQFKSKKTGTLEDLG